MEGKGKNESEKSFRIDDLLQRKVIIDPVDMPIELTTCKRQFSPPSGGQVSPAALKCDRGGRDSLSSPSPSPSRSRLTQKSQLSSCCNVSPVSSESESLETNAPTASSYFTGFQVHPSNSFPVPTFNPHLSRLFGGTNAPLSLDTSSGARELHPHLPQFLGRPPTSQDLGNPLFFHQPPHHHRIHHHHAYAADFPLWHGHHGPSVQNSLITSYTDPRCFDYKYPSSTLFTPLPCGTEYMTGRGFIPLMHGESKRKGGQIRFSNSQTSQLEKTFVEHKYQNAHERRKLAHSLGLTDRQVKTWFQNRRAKWRKQLGLRDVDDEPETNTNGHASFSESLRHALDRTTITEGKSLARHE